MIAVLEASQRRLADALHVAVVNATRRMRDPGLAHRVLAAEGRHIAAEHQLQFDAIREVCERPWRDEFGKLHSPFTGEVITA